MLKAAQRVIVLADGSKVGQTELALLCPVERIDVLLTGESADAAVVQRLGEQGCDVRIVR
jgi:DeoR/GlpR family transcriptional regulator of sugar metabolism